MRLVGERNDWYKKYVEATGGFKDVAPTLNTEKPMDLGAADGEGKTGFKLHHICECF